MKRAVLIVMGVAVVLGGCAMHEGATGRTQLAGSWSQPVDAPPDPPSDLRAPTQLEIGAMIEAGIRAIAAMEEGAERGEWPYQGVYRVKGQIPIGYRVGGTAICCQAMSHHPEFEARRDLRGAVSRGIAFMVRATGDGLMSHEAYDGGYDVRGWGYIYALSALVEFRVRGLIDDGAREGVDRAIAFYLRGLETIEIPESGGWNYARPPGRDRAGKTSPFMTSAALQALFVARADGMEVDPGVVERGLVALEGALHDSGEATYSGAGAGRDGGGSWPGAIGRTASAHATLFLAGRATEEEIRTTLDRFVEHWKWLEARRAKPGTHTRPYGVAPYYFFFAHHAAAQASMCLPEGERAAYRDRLNALLVHVRDGEALTWNDRVFERSANYGTAMACMALMIERVGLPAAWDGGGE